VATAAGVLADGDAVADGEFLGSDEDVLDDGAQDALLVFGGGGAGRGDLLDRAVPAAGFRRQPERLARLLA
jgi:hypothetical protein